MKHLCTKEYIVLYHTIFNDKVRFQIIDANSKQEDRDKLIDELEWVCIDAVEEF